jgi:hypothetical protein
MNLIKSIDFGIVNIAVGSDGKSYAGNSIEKVSLFRRQPNLRAFATLHMHRPSQQTKPPFFSNQVRAL